MEEKQEFINWFLQAEKYLNPLLSRVGYEMILNENAVKFIDLEKKQRPRLLLLEVNWTLKEAVDCLYYIIAETIRDYYDCCN